MFDRVFHDDDIAECEMRAETSRETDIDNPSNIVTFEHFRESHGATDFPDRTHGKDKILMFHNIADSEFFYVAEVLRDREHFFRHGRDDEDFFVVHRV